MAVAALAYAGRAFGQEAWVAEAIRTAEVLLARLRRPDGRWLRSWRPATDFDACPPRWQWGRPGPGSP